MKSTQFILNFPETSGFSTTEINFYEGIPAPQSIYLTNEAQDITQARLFVTDTTIASLDCMKEFLSYFDCTKPEENDFFRKENNLLLILGAGEKYKTFDNVLNIVKCALENNLDRKACFVAIGGGVLCDMTGFAASIYKRGVDCEFVPTTLLAMVDASVGGKTGCDYEGYKNMTGTFWPAKKLHVWPEFVQTLPENEFISGLAEAVKTAFLFDADLSSMLKSEAEKIIKRDEKTLHEIITKCVQHKAAIVHEDLRERGRRAFLNLGHTFGHALEATAGLGDITHGEAVAWGMARAADLSLNLNLCNERICQETKDILKALGYDTNPYPEVLQKKSVSKEDALKQMLKAMAKDKKNQLGNKIRCILQKNFQDTVILEVEESQILPVLQ